MVPITGRIHPLYHGPQCLKKTQIIAYCSLSRFVCNSEYRGTRDVAVKHGIKVCLHWQRPRPRLRLIPLPMELGLMIITVRNVVAERLCFHRCLSFCSQGGGVSQHALGQTPPFADPPSRHPQGRQPPSPKATAADGKHPTGMHSCARKW